MLMEIKMKIQWAVGVTTVVERVISGSFNRAVDSLQNAGFEPKFNIYCDDWNCGTDIYRFNWFSRQPPDGECLRSAAGNWFQGLLNLYIRNRTAHYFAMFQDDIIASKNLRQYLEDVITIDCNPSKTKAYFNLFTAPCNQPDKLAVRFTNGKYTHKDLDPQSWGFYPSNQLGYGALGLVFSNRAVCDLLSSQYFIDGFQHQQLGDKSIDGRVCMSLREKGYTEYVHNPSLLQHVGEVTTIPGNPKHLPAESFQGEDFDCMRLLKEGRSCLVTQ